MPRPRKLIKPIRNHSVERQGKGYIHKNWTTSNTDLSSKSTAVNLRVYMGLKRRKKIQDK